MKDRLIRKSIHITLIVLSMTIFNLAQRPGSLDASFGNGGLIYAKGVASNSYVWADDIELQGDGKIVVTGRHGGSSCFYGGGGSNFSCETYLARFLPNGSLDATFGIGGEVFIYPGPVHDWAGYGSNVAIQPDGKIVVVGSYYDNYVLRFLPNGNLDSTFDGDGKLILTDLLLGDVAIQTDGRIVLAGWIGQGLNADLAVARLYSDGSLDNTFGVNGIERTDIDGFGSAAYGVVLQSDGKIVVLGSYGGGDIENNVALARYNDDGSMDKSFGDLGLVTTNIFSIDTRDIAVQRDNKLVVAGGTWDTGLLLRFNANGWPDSSFGNAGLISRSGLVFHGVAIQSNGRIIVGGASPDDFIGQHVITRYLANGIPDSSFGENGVVYTAFPSETGYYYGGGTRALSIQPDGKIIGAGSWVEAYCSEYCIQWGGYSAIARYISKSFAVVDFDGDGRTDISVYRPSDGNWYVLNSGNDPSYSITNWGASTDIETAADFDNDGKTDIAVYRPSTGEWFVVNSFDSSFTVTNWGAAGDRPLAKDFDGDGRADISVYRPSNGTWYIFRSDGTGWDIVQWGAADDIPVPGNFDSDNKADIAVYRSSTGQWFVLPSMGGGYAVSWGTPGDKPVAADYDGDGKDDIAVYRPSEGNWYILKSSTNNSQADVISWGVATDIPVPGDYDGDGRADVAQFRPSSGDWFVLRSTSGYDVVNWGIGTDKPIPASYFP